MSVGVTDNFITKACTCCGKVKDHAEFYFRKSENRLESRCKQCVSVSKGKSYGSKRAQKRKPQQKIWAPDQVTIELSYNIDPNIDDDLHNLLEEWVMGVLKEA